MRRVQQQHDSAAFEQLYRRHVDRIYPLALRMAGDTGRAEELTQDVFVHVWQKIHQFRGASAFSTWLYRVAVTIMLRRLRARSDAQRRHIALDDIRSDLPTIASVDVDLRIDLARAMMTLPARARLVFILHDIEGLTHEMISHIIRATVGTSKAQLHRARRLLRERIVR